MATTQEPPQNGTSVQPPTPTSTTPQPTKPAQHWAPTVPATAPAGRAVDSSHPPAARYGPSTFFLTMDILVKLIAAASLLGILVVLAMILSEIRDANGSIDKTLSGMRSEIGQSLRTLASTGSAYGQPLKIQLSREGSFSAPIYMKAA